MIRSMTGYGQGTAERSGLRVGVELRSVNNRFADLRLRLPQDLASSEREIRSRILGRVKRGRVELAVTIERVSEGEPRPALNRTLLAQLLAARQSLSEEFDIDGPLELSTVLAVPGMLRVDNDDEDWTEEGRVALTDALELALESLDNDRGREGQNLQRELQERITGMIRALGSIREHTEAMPGRLRDRLIERLRALGGEIELDPARVAQEAVLLAERADVTEEIVRLEGHLQQARALLEGTASDPIGKRMEFLLQEIHRETNTLTSKSTDLTLSAAALSLKSETEKVREQIQNLE